MTTETLENHSNQELKQAPQKRKKVSIGPVMEFRREGIELIDMFIIPKTKSLMVNIPNRNLSSELIAELINTFQWCQEHTEVKTLIINPQSEIYPEFYFEDLAGRDQKEIEKYFQSFLELQTLFHNLPQLTVFNLSNCESYAFFELSLAADMRLASEFINVPMPMIKRGLFPMAGTLAMMNEKQSESLKQAVYLSKDLNIETLIKLDLTTEVYKKSSKQINQILRANHEALSEVRASLKFLNSRHEKFEHFSKLSLETNKKLLATNEFRMRYETQKAQIIDLNREKLLRQAL
ncbi:MAG: hypothetical protein ACPGJV_03895 [Bacteriovoracaceae bacterium]